MPEIFNKDFKDFLKALNNNAVEYLLVGGFAVILHGYSRTTGDMDIWVNRTNENYKKLEAAFREFGMPVFDMTENNFLHHPVWDVFTFGIPPSAIDVMLEVKGLVFSEAYAERQVIKVQEIHLNILSKEYLIKAKKNSGRFKDLDDIQNLS